MPVKRSTTPLKVLAAPIGICTGMAPGASSSLISFRTLPKFACILSIIDTKIIRGRVRSSQSCQTISVPTSTPEVALTVTSAASATRAAAVASPTKSMYPGVSRRLTFVPSRIACATVSCIDMP